MKYIAINSAGQYLSNPAVLSQGWSRDRKLAHLYDSAEEAERDGRESGRGYASSPSFDGVRTPVFDRIEEVDE